MKSFLQAKKKSIQEGKTKKQREENEKAVVEDTVFELNNE